MFANADESVCGGVDASERKDLETDGTPFDDELDSEPREPSSDRFRQPFEIAAPPIWEIPDLEFPRASPREVAIEGFWVVISEIFKLLGNLA